MLVCNASRTKRISQVSGNPAATTDAGPRTQATLRTGPVIGTGASKAVGHRSTAPRTHNRRVIGPDSGNAVITSIGAS